MVTGQRPFSPMLCELHAPAAMHLRQLHDETKLAYCISRQAKLV